MPTNDAAKEKHEETPKGWWNREEWWSEHIVEILLAIATLLLWIATRDLVRGAEKTAERQLRAYVGIDTTDLEFAPGGKIFAEITAKNSGQTPAHDFYCTYAMQTHKPLPEPFSEPVNEGESFLPSRTVIPPGGVLKTNLQIRLPEEVITSLHQGTLMLYISGTMRYRHIFNVDECVTQFRFFWHSKQKGWQACHEGNNAT